LESQAELVRATSYCKYVISDVRGHHVSFWARKMNSKIWKSLTVYVSSGGSM